LADIHRSSDIRRLTRELLQELCKSAGADVLTCHFRNPYSGNYWLLDRVGHFRHEYSLHGPLTLRRQIERMGADYEPSFACESDPGTTFNHFDSSPIAFKQNVLAGPSFVSREGIKHSIRLCLHDTELIDDSAAIVVFLSYRSSVSFPTPQAFQKILDERIGILRPILRHLAREPRLDSESSWRLRSAVWTLQRDIAEPLEDGERLSQIYSRIARQTFESVVPKQGHNTVCTLHKVTVANDLELLAVHPPHLLIPTEPGIVDYVGHSGVLHSIENISAYERQRKIRELQPASSGDSPPPYVEYHQNSQSGIACPLIVQNRVIGVLNLESDAAEAFQDTQLLMLWQFAGIAAMAVRQGAMWQGTVDATEMQQEQLRCQTVGDIFERTSAAVKRLGYHYASVWDAKAERWHGGRPQWDSDPRKNYGYTADVLAKRSPVVLIDLRPIDEKGIQGHFCRGRLSGQLLFEGWGEASPLPFPLNEGTKKYVFGMLTNSASQWDVVTDLALPIFADPANPQSDVVGVLWATTKRHFLSLLDDEVWRLTSICRLTSVSLAVLDSSDLSRKQGRV
jgi:GAF domain-containing protein